MNPPFGTRNTGIDAEFVTIAMKNARSVYSLHKTSTRDVRTCVRVDSNALNLLNLANE